jgi:hypothetical protein
MPNPLRRTDWRWGLGRRGGYVLMAGKVRREGDHAHAWWTRSSHHTLDGLVRYQHCSCGQWRITVATEAALAIGPTHETG